VLRGFWSGRLEEVDVGGRGEGMVHVAFVLAFAFAFAFVAQRPVAVFELGFECVCFVVVKVGCWTALLIAEVGSR
jgi:hypothetical protein